jgi:hypothetical protein
MEDKKHEKNQEILKTPFWISSPFSRKYINKNRWYVMVWGMGNSPSKHRIFGKKFTQYKKCENLGKFGLF